MLAILNKENYLESISHLILDNLLEYLTVTYSISDLTLSIDYDINII